MKCTEKWKFKGKAGLRVEYKETPKESTQSREEVKEFVSA